MDGLHGWSSGQVLATFECVFVVLYQVFIIAVHLGNKVIFYELSLLTLQVTVDYSYTATLAAGDDSMSITRVIISLFFPGFDGTSNVLAGKLFGIPVSGTHAHSFVSSYNSLDDVRDQVDSVTYYLTSFCMCLLYC